MALLLKWRRWLNPTEVMNILEAWPILRRTWQWVLGSYCWLPGKNGAFLPIWVHQANQPRAFQPYQQRHPFHTYVVASFETIKKGTRGNALVLKHRRFADNPLKPVKIDQFRVNFPLGEIGFVRDEDGNISGFTASSGRTRGILFELVRMGQPSNPANQ